MKKNASAEKSLGARGIGATAASMWLYPLTASGASSDSGKRPTNAGKRELAGMNPVTLLNA